MPCRRSTNNAMTEKIIPFDGHERLLTKVRTYLSALDELINDGDQGVEMLQRAFQIADDPLKVKIVIMLGTIARPRVGSIRVRSPATSITGSI